MAATSAEKRAMMWTASGKRAKAMADPKRARILQHLIEEGVKAPSEIANELLLPLNAVSYHCKKLEDFDCVELVKTENVRGSCKHYWRATDIDWVSDEDWEGMEDSRKPGALLGMMSWVVGDFDHALEADTFDDGRWHIIRNPLRAVDQQALDDLMKAHMELYERSVEIQREASERLQTSGEESIRISSSSQCFRVESFSGRKQLVESHRPDNG